MTDGIACNGCARIYNGYINVTVGIQHNGWEQIERKEDVADKKWHNEWIECNTCMAYKGWDSM
jgi:hypothetical protein